MINPSLQEIISEAKGQYLAGLNCAEAAFWALAKYWKSTYRIPWLPSSEAGSPERRTVRSFACAMLAIGASGKKRPCR